MTEEEWFAWNNPQALLRYLLGTNEPRVQDVDAFPDLRTSHRKLRLFACACYYHISHLLPHQVARAAVEIAERFTDGAASRGELELAEAGIRALINALEPHWRVSQGAARVALHAEHAALAIAGIVCWRDAPKAAWYALSNAYLDFPYLANPGVGVHDRARGEAEAAEMRAQCVLLRDIVGNPIRTVEFSPEWRTSTAVMLAKQMYDSRDFAAMPILADALQDAGCDSADVLAHCRDAKQTHVRGCWVLDWVLGKE